MLLMKWYASLKMFLSLSTGHRNFCRRFAATKRYVGILGDLIIVGYVIGCHLVSESNHNESHEVTMPQRSVESCSSGALGEWSAVQCESIAIVIKGKLYMYPNMCTLEQRT